MPASTWQLSLFGGIELRGPDAAAAKRVLVQPKHVALLAYLLAGDSAGERQRFRRRDHLVALFWPELDQPHARASLRRVVHALRAALGAEALLSRGDEELAPGEGVLECDVAAFVTAIRAGQLARALELYAGELMPGFHLSGCGEFERWLEDRRMALRQEAAAAAWALAQRFEAEKNPTLAEGWARRAFVMAWDDERVLRRALEMLDRVGNRAGALRLFDEFAQRLRAEFDAAPSPETLAVVARMRSG